MSLRTYMIVWIVLIFLVGTVALIAFLNAQARRYDQEILSRYSLILELFTRNLAGPINNAMVIQQTDEVRRIIHQIREQRAGTSARTIEFVHVVDANGTVIASTDPEMEGRTLPAKMWRRLRQRLEPQTERIVHGEDPRILYYYPMVLVEFNEFMGGIVSGLSLRGYVGLKRSVQSATIGFEVLIMIGLLVFLYGFSYRTIFRPLSRMTAAIHQILEQRDLRIRVPVQRRNEIGYLAEAFNVMLDFLQRTLANMRRTSHHMNNVSEELYRYAQQLMDGSDRQIEAVRMTHRVLQSVRDSTDTIAENMNALMQFAEDTTAFLRQAEASVDQVSERAQALTHTVQQNSQVVLGITGAIRDVGRAAEEMSAAVSEAAAAVTELNFSIREVEHSAEEAAVLSQQMVENAEAGQQAVERTLSGMYQIQKTFSRAAASMDQLISLTEAINRISANIQNIASQTHLLSINASILASQAGEHGRAFSVIVRQIQQMADQTSQYTREIEQLSHRIQSTSADSREAIDESREAIQQGVEVAEQARRALKTILESNQQVHAFVLKIARATKEQARGSGQIQEAANRVSEMAGSLNNVLHNLQEASRAIEQSTQELQTFVEGLKTTLDTQIQGSRQMFRSVAQISRMLETVEQSLRGQRQDIRQLVDAMRTIREISEMSTRLVEHLREIVRNMHEQNRQMDEQVRQFHLEAA